MRALGERHGNISDGWFASSARFGTSRTAGWFVAKLRPAVMAELAPEHSTEWQGLGVSILHKLVIDRLLREKVGGTPVCRYVHTLAEVAETARKCQVAVLVPPVSMNHVERIAGNLETMPAKSLLPRNCYRDGPQLLKKD